MFPFPQTFPIFAQNTTDASTSFTAHAAFYAAQYTLSGYGLY
jgi:hypothetical protein